MNEILVAVATAVGALGGWEAVKYLLNRKTNTRKAEAEADHSEFKVLSEAMAFLQEQVKSKEERFAEQTNTVRVQNSEILELNKKIALLEAKMALKLCERRGCKERQPQSDY